MDIYELFAAAQAHSLPDEPDNGGGGGDAAGAAAAGADTSNAAGGEGGGDAGAGGNDPPPDVDADVMAAIDQVQAAENPDDVVPAAARPAGQEGDDAAGGAGGTGAPEIDPATGKPVAKTGEEDQSAPATEPDEIDKEASAEAEKLGLKNEEANARFKELYRENRRIPELEQRATRGDELFGAIQRSGATGDQFGTALFYLEAVNTGDLGKLAAAHDWLQTELAWLSEKLGKPKPGADVLAGHEDLLAQVEGGEITREAAEELAQHRGTVRLQNAAREQQQQRQQQHDQHQQQMGRAVEQARQAVNILGERLVAEEQGAEGQARAKQLLEHVLTTEKERITKLPPSQWAGEIELAYLRLKQRAQVQAPQQPQQPRPRIGHQPLRPIGGVSQPVKQPTNEREALELGLQLANEGHFGGGY